MRLCWPFALCAGLVFGARVQAEPDAAVGEATDRGAYHPQASKYADAGSRPVVEDVPQGAQVLRIPIEGTIDLGLAAFVRRALGEHEDAALVVLELNTLGGRVDAAIQIRDALLDSSVRTVAFIHPRAISAGALIALACDVIAISAGGSMGAVTPVMMGESGSEAVEEKMVSYMRAEMRSTAEAQGRRGDVAEAMVDRSVEIEGVVPSGKLLTLDTERALALRIADLRVGSLEALFAALALKAPVRIDAREHWAETVARFLTDPTVSSLLIGLGMLALMIEVYSPGLGIPGAIGVLCLLAFFFGHAVAQLAGLEELLLVALGLVLIAVELFVVPGTVIAGVAGVALLLLGYVLSLVGLPLDASFETGLLLDAVVRVSAAFLVAVALGLVALHFLPRSGPARRLVLSSATATSEGFVAGEVSSELLGQTGRALTDLHPAGKAELRGERIDVVSEGDYIARGEAVAVIEVKSGRIVVRRVEGDG